MKLFLNRVWKLYKKKREHDRNSSIETLKLIDCEVAIQNFVPKMEGSRALRDIILRYPIIEMFKHFCFHLSFFYQGNDEGSYML